MSLIAALRASNAQNFKSTNAWLNIMARNKPMRDPVISFGGAIVTCHLLTKEELEAYEQTTRGGNGSWKADQVSR